MAPPPLQKGKGGGGGSAADPKTTALTHLGIAIGSKNLKTLRREEVDAAFVTVFLGSAHLSDGGKLGTKKQYQRVLHESYQFLCKFISDQGPPPGLNSNSDPSSSSSGGISGMRRRGAMAAANAKK